MEEVAALKSIPMFSTMDEKELGELRKVMESQRFLPGQVIIREGEEGAYFYVLMAGEVQYLTTDVEDKEIVLDEAGPGSFFGELSMLTGEKRLVRVRAKGEVTTLSLDREQFHQFLVKHPHAAIDVLTAISRRLYTTDKMVRQSVSRNVNEEIEERMTVGERIADVIAAFSGSIVFLVLNACWFGGWLLCNTPWTTWWSEHAVFDPYPFGLLTMIVSLEAIFLSIFVLVSQNRQTVKDRLAADVDHAVNVRAEVKTGQIMSRLDDIEREMHLMHREVLTQVNSRNGSGDLDRKALAATT
jgi:CRP/FNR family cyclic AMP-dependent transcriptional regulator